MRGQARVRKEAYTYKGKKRLTSAWYVNITDHTGRFHAIPGFRDKGATVLLGQIIEQLDIAREARVSPDPVLVKRVQELPDKYQHHLARRGLISKATATVMRVVGDYIGQWLDYLAHTQASEQYRQQAAHRVRRIVAECGFGCIPDIERGKVQAWAHSFIEAGNAGETLATYIRSIKTFCNWLAQEGVVDSSPLKHLKINSRIPTPKKKPRRALWPDQCQTLLAVAHASGETVRSMSGPDRAILYQVALETGLRWSELFSLWVESFNLEGDPGTVTVAAAHSKRRREDVVPLRKALAEKLKEYFSGRNTSEKAFRGMLRDKGAKMLRFDLEKAGIPYKTTEGVADFHALRHSFITNLVRSGANPKMTQSLARHSTVELTLGRYSHVELREKIETLEKTLAANEGRKQCD